MKSPEKIQTEIDRLVTAASAEQSGEISQGLLRGLSAVRRFGEDVSSHIWWSLARRLPDIPSPAGAGAVALFLGAEVERGMPAEKVFPTLKETFLKWLPLSAEEETEDYGCTCERREGEPVRSGLTLLGRALVSCFVRLPDALAGARKDTALMSELRPFAHLSHGVAWVLELLKQCSGELVVLDGPARSGFAVSYRNLSSCFHLFTLLQQALAKELPAFSNGESDLLAAASPAELTVIAGEAWWLYCQVDPLQHGLPSPVNGAGSPSGIPRFADKQVLILHPCPAGGCLWPGSLFHPWLEESPAAVEVTRLLTADEIDFWWRSTGLKGLTASSIPGSNDASYREKSEVTPAYSCTETVASLRFDPMHIKPLGVIGMTFVLGASLVLIGTSLSTATDHAISARIGLFLAGAALGWVCWMTNRRYYAGG